jgi:hypothetical protein
MFALGKLFTSRLGDKIDGVATRVLGKFDDALQPNDAPVARDLLLRQGIGHKINGDAT